MYPQQIHDYRQAAKYTNHRDNRKAWAWELVRRNEDYQRAFDDSDPDLFKSFLGFVEDWRNEYSGGPFNDVFDYAGPWPLRWPSREAGSLDDEYKTLMQLSSQYRDNPQIAVFAIDLEFPPGQQLEALKTLIKGRRKDIKEVRRANQPSVKLLRILDARAFDPKTGRQETVKEIAKVLKFPESDYKDLSKRAYRLRDTEFWKIYARHR